MTEIYRIYKVNTLVVETLAYGEYCQNTIFVCQVDLKVDDVRPRMDKNGNIRKNDFIELSMEAKLLDVTERKAPAAETPKEQKKTVNKLYNSNCKLLQKKLSQHQFGSKWNLNFWLTFSLPKSKYSRESRQVGGLNDQVKKEYLMWCTNLCKCLVFL